MKYYKVKKQSDQIRYNNGKKFLIANELYTSKEYEKIELADKSKYFDTVQISKNHTYFFFGARFKRNTNTLI